MTDKEFDLMMQHNPHLRVVGEPDRATAVLARDHALTQQARELLALPSEHEMQCAVIAWADAQAHPALKWLFHVPNGGYRDAATGAQMKAQGVRPGCPDLHLPWAVGDSPGLCIEMKRRPNKPSAEQREWLAHLAAQGWQCQVCYSAEEAIRVISEYLGLPSLSARNEVQSEKGTI